MKLSKLSKTSLLLFICFGLDKLVAIVRQLIIARQFGLSPELDVFNIANNLPDMLYSLISGGALSLALIPVMADVINRSGKTSGWRLFSSIANLSFVVSAALAVIIAFFAKTIVTSEIGIAPGFSQDQQQLVVNLMRLNLIATLIFSVSGLIMGGLQANQHFLFPALAPIFYNAGQIFGALILAPDTPYQIGPVRLPCLGMGIYGLVGGVLLGALAHLLIQVPGLIRNQFHWTPCIALHAEDVQRVLRILGPRVLSVFFVQLIFIVRDNLASRLAPGSVTALSYGYMFQQLPETLIGTAIGTAILPSLSLFTSEGDTQKFSQTVEKACRLALAFSLGIAVLMGLGLGPLIGFAFKLDGAQNDLMMWTLRGYLLGLAGHCLLEIANRAFYAQEEALIPLFGTIINLALYIGIGAAVYQHLDAPGISLTDSLAFTVQALFMLLLLRLPARQLPDKETNAFLHWLEGGEKIQRLRIPVQIHMGKTLLRSLLGALASAAVCICLIHFAPESLNILVKSIVGMILGLFVYLLFILPELKILKKF